MTLSSYSNLLVVKPYAKAKELKTDKRIAGFSMIEAQTGVEPLELLVDANVVVGLEVLSIQKGALIYFQEASLHNEEWSRKSYKSQDLPDGFALAPFEKVIYIKI